MRPFPDLADDELAVVPLAVLQAATAVLAKMPYELVAPIAEPLTQIYTLDEFTTTGEAS